MAEIFNVVISPAVQKGKTEQAVSKELAQMLRIDQKKVFGWLKAKHPTLIARGVSKQVADNYSQIIASSGATCQILSAQQMGKAGQTGKKLKGGISKEEARRLRSELDRLIQKEQQIMKQLGMRVPGGLSRLFLKSPFTAAILIIILTAAALYSADYWLKTQEKQRLMATPASQPVQDAAGVTAAAVHLYQSGNGRLLTEMAEVTAIIKGQTAESLDQTSNVAVDMMKGLGSEPFVKMLDEGGIQQQLSTGSAGNIEVIREFTFEDISKISPAFLLYGHENLLSRTAERDELPILNDPDGKVILIDRLEKLEDANIVSLMKGLSVDQEWDQYLRELIDRFLEIELVDEADILIEEIKNPVVKIQSFGKIMAYLQQRNQPKVIAKFQSKAMAALVEVVGPDAKARALMELARSAASAGAETVPQASIERIQGMLVESENVSDKPRLAGQLAAIQFQVGDITGARASIKHALNLVSAIPEEVERLSALCQMSKRYYDVRNLTLAQEILNEVALVAATRLNGAERSRIFGEIAIARGYTGDMVGARTAAGNASGSRGKQQILAGLGRSFVEQHKPYLAWMILNEITDEVERSKILIRLVSWLIHTDNNRQASYYLRDWDLNIRQIAAPELKVMVLGQIARLHRRLNEDERANRLFAQALQIVNGMKGRKADFALASIALDQAKALRLEGARISVNKIKESIIKDPVAAEVDRIEKILTNLLPAGI